MTRRSLSGCHETTRFTNSVGAKWLEYEELSRLREDVIKVFIRGRSDGKAAVDYTINAEVGIPWLTGPIESGHPVNHVLPAWDGLAGYMLAAGLLAAELRRARTGEGQLINLSLMDVALSIAGNLGFTLPDTSGIRIQTYTTAFTTTPITSANANAVGFTISKAPQGATYNYTITSSGGGGSVAGSGSIGSNSEAVTGVVPDESRYIVDMSDVVTYSPFTGPNRLRI